MPKPIQWFAFQDFNRARWRTHFSSSELSPDLLGQPGTRGFDGLTYTEQRVILIDAASKRSVQDYTTLHEVMHASVDNVEGLSGHAEEAVITAMAPRLYPILHHFGLQWPERPEELAALERRARRLLK